jgi:superfamily I DNA/RNA helicase
MAFVPSIYQQAIFDKVRANFVSGPGFKATRKNYVVNAVAGSGKSTTIKQAINNCVPKGLPVLVVAFNSSVATAMRPQLPGRDVKTYHALGRAGIYAANRNTQTVDQSNDKNNMILKQFLDPYLYRGLYYTIGRYVSLAKNTLLDDLSNDSLELLGMEYNLDPGDDWERVYDAVRRVMYEAREMTDIIDFDDMVWFPHIHNWVQIPQYSLVAVDELQDTNLAQNILIRKAIAPDGMIIGVGDPAQSIYAFRGADTFAMSKFAQDFNAEELPLSISYRCPLAVVEYVNQHFSEICFEAAPNAIQGSVNEVKATQINLNAGDMVLCRLNAPLVPLAFRLIQSGKKAIIKGRDIGTNLQTIIRKMKADEIGDFMEKLRDYRDREVYRLNRAEKTIAAQSIDDKVECIIHIAENCQTVSEVSRRIETIFSDQTAPITLSSAHKAKGLEAENVFIVEPHLMPSNRAKTPTEIQQERNLWYVAATRSQNTLNFVR